MTAVDNLLHVIGSILSWEDRSAFRAQISREVVGAETEKYLVTAYPASSEVEITGITHEYLMKLERPFMQVSTPEGTSTRACSAARVPGGIAVLIFPLTMPIWGRTRDTFRMTELSESSDNFDALRILLSGTRDPALSGFLTYSKTHRACVELSLPGERIAMHDIEDL